MKRKTFLLFLSLLLATSPLYAKKNEEAQKQLEILNQKIQKAGEVGDLQTAIGTAEEALQLASKEIGPESLETAKAMNNVANLYMYVDHAENAERLYKQAILIEAKHYRANDPALADSFYNLAMAYAVQKKYDEARKMLDKAYKIRVEKLGADHPDSQKIQKVLKEIWAETPSV